MRTHHNDEHTGIVKHKHLKPQVFDSSIQTAGFSIENSCRSNLVQQTAVLPRERASQLVAVFRHIKQLLAIFSLIS
jgi:hypothetical protein